MKKDSMKNGMFPILKHRLIFAGYFTTLLGLIIMFGAYSESNGLDVLTSGFSVSLVPILYGYMSAYTLDPSV